MVPEFLMNAYILSTMLKQGNVTQVTLRHVMLITSPLWNKDSFFSP